MGTLGVAFLATGTIAVFAGFFLGWAIGRRIQKFDNEKDIARSKAYRENAQIDFEFVRSKADEIVSLANEIGKRSKRAHDTVLTAHADMGEPPGPSGEHGMVYGTKAADQA